jgi:hypothetical protein
MTKPAIEVKVSEVIIDGVSMSTEDGGRRMVWGPPCESLELVGTCTTKRHRCEWKLPHKAHGEAIESCIEDEEGRFWVDNTEYASQVNYCPYCGAKAPVQVAPDTALR